MKGACFFRDSLRMFSSGKPLEITIASGHLRDRTFRDGMAMLSHEVRFLIKQFTTYKHMNRTGQEGTAITDEQYFLLSQSFALAQQKVLFISYCTYTLSKHSLDLRLFQDEDVAPFEVVLLYTPADIQAPRWSILYLTTLNNEPGDLCLRNL